MVLIIFNLIENHLYESLCNLMDVVVVLGEAAFSARGVLDLPSAP